MPGFICSTPIYEYKGWTFEFNQYHTAPWPLKKDGEPRKCAGRVFWAVFDEWFALPEDEREKCRVAGGCQRF